MNYTIYKITNKTNAKVYIGCHQTNDLDDGYYGSGLLICRAVEKHGLNNFEKEILFIFDNPEEMFKKESELVNEDFIARDDTYNLKLGGFGGWDYINSGPLRTSGHDSEMHKRISETMKGNKPHANTILALKQRHADGLVIYDNFKGKTHSDETKAKIGAANSIHQSGKNNSQYGTCWVYSESQKVSKRIKKSELDYHLSENWIKGRKIKFN